MKNHFSQEVEMTLQQSERQPLLTLAVSASVQSTLLWCLLISYGRWLKNEMLSHSCDWPGWLSVWGRGGWRASGARLWVGSSKSCWGWWLDGKLLKIPHFCRFQPSNPSINGRRTHLIWTIKNWQVLWRKSHTQLDGLLIRPFPVLRKFPTSH